MITFPNAKINIGLNIVEKRNDGYHNIESVFCPVPFLKDALEVVENRENDEVISFSSSGIAIPGDVSDNLCSKAYYLIKADYPLPNLKIHLHKLIPIGAGLGGGSADAAFFIRLVNEKFDLHLSIEQMLRYAEKLGSDCAFFIKNEPMYAEEVGNVFTPIELSLKGLYLTLIHPNIHVNTAKAYQSVTSQKAQRSLFRDVHELPIENWKEYIHNQFEDSVFVEHPEIKVIKEKLYSSGAIYSAMSGSGSAVYGIFKKPTDLKKTFGNYFVVEGIL